MDLRSPCHVRLRAALDQAFFFLAIFGLSYFAMLACGGGSVALRWYALFVLACLPLAGVSAAFAAQLSRLTPPPAEPRNRLALREIRPQRREKHDRRHAA